MNRDDIHRYDDIIDLPHPEPRHHVRMTPENRAAQFAPFAALTGHGAAVRETARLTERRIELDENMKAELDEKLRYIMEQSGQRPQISVTYFIPDEKKAGGTYVTAHGRVKRTDPLNHRIVLEDGTQIPMVQILEIRESDSGSC